MYHTSTNKVPLVHTTESTPHAVYLSDRFGEWHPSINAIPMHLRSGHREIAERFPTDLRHYKLAEGDPRVWQLSENCFVATRHGKLGILVEYEIDAVLAEYPEEDVEPAEYSELDYNALCNEFDRDLSHLPAKWAPEAEIFLADGYHTMEGRLTVCAFVALKGDMQKGFTSPFAPEDPRQMTGLLSDIEAVLFGPKEVRELGPSASADNGSPAP